MKKSRARILLTSVYSPFCVDDPFDSPHNQAQHNAVHRQFTREQGAFAIEQQTSHVGLHLIAINLDADVDILEYPSLGDFEDTLRKALREGRPYDWLGISAPSTFVRKARRMVERAKEISPSTGTILGGGGAMAVGELVERFTDQVCVGDGVRFMRDLLGQDTEAPVRHGAIPSAHLPNRIMNVRGNSVSYGIVPALGCDRGCEFCATSAQFDGRQPVLRTPEELLSAMRSVEDELCGQGEEPSSIFFVVFDENFLRDHDFSRSFLEIVRKREEHGPLYLSFLFSDAESVKRFTAEELLEMGVDAIWIGLERSDSTHFSKTEGTDFKALVDDLQGNGIKVILSFIAGYEDQTRADMERDISFALGLGPAAYQYSSCCPMPGTPLYKRLKAEGRLAIPRPEVINMSHYYIVHPEMDEAYVRAQTCRFQREDYERHGPMALRFMKLRLDGFVKHRDSTKKALKARAQGFREELISAAPVLSVGRVMGPTPGVREEFGRTARRLREALPTRSLLPDVIAKKLPPSKLLRYFVVTHPAMEPVVRWGLVAWALGADPRVRDNIRTPLGLLRNGRRAVEIARHGMMPWDQPLPVLTRYSEGRRVGPFGRVQEDRAEKER